MADYNLDMSSKMFQWIRKHKFVFSIMLLFIMGSTLLVLIFYLPTLNLSHIQLTLNHRGDVTTILTPIIETEWYDPDYVDSITFEVQVVYEYTSSCIVSLVRFHAFFVNGRERTGRLIFQIEFNNGRWEYDKRLDITLTPYNGLIPEVPPYFSCQA